MLRRSIIIVISAFGLAAYVAVMGSFEPGSIVESLLKQTTISHETAVYLQRFTASALFLGVLPVVVALASGTGLKSLGITRPRRFGGPVWTAGFIAAGTIIGLSGALDASIQGFYPYHPSVGSLIPGQPAPSFVLHGALYLVLYYIPWEITFRGIMVVTVTDQLLQDRPVSYRPSEPDDEAARIGRVALLVALLQTAPSAMLHFGHPVSEILGAVVFGVISGYLTVTSRSILPALAIHATAGITLDLFLTLGI